MDREMISQRVTRGIRTLTFWMCVFILAASASAHAESKLNRIPTQYIAALGDPGAKSGTDAQTWGLWPVDPGPRGVHTRNFADLIARAGVAPAGWRYDATAWWLEEHGLIMEAPVFPLPPGKYAVTGGRDVTAVLSIEAADVTGKQAWSLSDGATIYDVTHLRCRAALYTPKADGQLCTPDKTPTRFFPMGPDESMPSVTGCNKRDYQVLIVVGMITES